MQLQKNIGSYKELLESKRIHTEVITKSTHRRCKIRNVSEVMAPKKRLVYKNNRKAKHALCENKQSKEESQT